MQPGRLVRISAVLMIALIASSCGIGTVFDDAASSVGFGPEPQPPPQAVSEVPPRAAAAHSPDQWCRAVAGQDRDEARKDGFDATTQQRRYDVTYRQCSAVMASPEAP